MKFTHLSQVPVGRVVDTLPPERNAGMKPRGFWVSVDNDWESWCQRSRNFGNYNFQHEVTLKGNMIATYANAMQRLYDQLPTILLLDTEDAVRLFASDYEATLYPEVDRYEAVTWGSVMKHFSGIIIAPYQYSLRMAEGFLWYYSWDCASGCIWDANAIEKIGEPTPIDLHVTHEGNEE